MLEVPGVSVGPPADSVIGSLSIASISGDSLFGAYSVPFISLGLRIGRVTPGPQLLQGRVAGRKFQIELTPDATDAGLWLDGEIQGHSVGGTWYSEQGRGRGSFTVTVAQ